MLAENGKVVVLTSILKARPTRTRSKPLRHTKSAVSGRMRQSPSGRRFSRSIGERSYTGGYLWGIPRPQYADSAIRHLTWLDDRLLVCAEAMQPILCLNGDTGSEIWRLERLWEFQRGFIGPSVWSHFISRYGIEGSGSEETYIENSRQYQCALVAGPVAVPLSVPRRGGSHSISLPSQGVRQSGGPVIFPTASSTSSTTTASRSRWRNCRRWSKGPAVPSRKAA